MNLFRYIPGFRSGTLWKQIIASLYYLISIYFFIHTWSMLMFLLTVPFAIFSFLDIIIVSPLGYSIIGSKYIFIVSIVLLVISGIGIFKSFFNLKPKKKKGIKSNLQDNNLLKVHFLDVGQADSILIQQSRENMLIDTGYHINGKALVKYLQKNGVDKLKYIIITHPHPDHIGGLPFILENIPVDKIIISRDNTFPINKNQKINEEALRMISSINIPIIHPKPGLVFKIGDSKLKIIAPNDNNYERVNDFSIVTKLVYGNTSYLFQADAETISEYEMLEKGWNLKSDVLKVSHHGSCTSSSIEFLKAVSPKYAVISVGHNSFYGQPDKCVLDRFKDMDTILYRTDKRGTIISASNGKKINFNTNSCSYPETKLFNTSVRKKYRILNGDKKSD